jgi:hypothetical protein
MILANGPSLKKDLPNIIQNDSKYEYFVMNDFVYDETFEIIKPKFYVLNDPLFFSNEPYSERGKKVLSEIKRKVDWQINLYIPYHHRNSEFLSELYNDKNINIITFHTPRYNGVESLRMFFYSRGFGNGQFGTVVLNAIYVSILLGIKKIHLFGVDHSFFKDLYVNEKNQMCYKNAHFYDSGEPVLEPLMCHYTGELHPYNMYQYLNEKTKIFKGHIIMNKFAIYMNAKVINHTRDSFIDAYERIN